MLGQEQRFEQNVATLREVVRAVKEAWAEITDPKERFASLGVRERVLVELRDLIELLKMEELDDR